MQEVIFSGPLTGQAGETVTITITKPDSTLETFTTLLLADETFAVTKEYVSAGSYTAQAHVDANPVIGYLAWDSAVVPFTIVMVARTGTLNVAVT